METLEIEQNFLPTDSGELRFHEEFPQLQSKSFPARSKLPLKRKTVSVSSLLYPPPRPTLPAAKFTLTPQLDTIKLKGEVPDIQKNCKCKQSRCLKLYCLCFSSGKYCNGCSCSNCQNNVENDHARQSAVEVLLQRNRNAFSAIFINSEECPSDNQDEAKDIVFLVKYKGCCCKRSKCLQMYCECLHAKLLCSDRCKCTDCKNFNGFKEKVSKESKKWKYLDNCFNSNRERLSNHMLPQNQQIVRPAESGSLKLTYRSTLAGIIKPQKVREFCAGLVVMSEAAKDKRDAVNLDIPSYEQSQKNCAAQMEEYNRAPEVQEAKPNGPPDASSDDKNLNSDCYSDIYIKQEKLVLARFLDFVNNLITSGAQEILESNLSTRTNEEDRSISVGYIVETEKKMFTNTEVQAVEKPMSDCPS